MKRDGRINLTDQGLRNFRADEHLSYDAGPALLMEIVARTGAIEQEHLTGLCLDLVNNLCGGSPERALALIRSGLVVLERQH
jgi:hypothetical protein